MNGAAAGYTAVLCAELPCRTEDFPDTAAALRECVRTSQHGVLVTAGCTAGAPGCRLRRPGPLLLVQPCDAERRPVGPAVRVGPVTGPEDISAIEEWMRDPRLDSAPLPAHLLDFDHRTRSAGRN